MLKSDSLIAEMQQSGNDALRQSVNNSLSQSEQAIKNGFQDIKTILTQGKVKINPQSGISDLQLVRI